MIRKLELVSTKKETTIDCYFNRLHILLRPVMLKNCGNNEKSTKFAEWPQPALQQKSHHKNSETCVIESEMTRYMINFVIYITYVGVQ